MEQGRTAQWLRAVKNNAFFKALYLQYNDSKREIVTFHSNKQLRLSKKKIQMSVYKNKMPLFLDFETWEKPICK